MASIFQTHKSAHKFQWLEPIAGTCLHGVCGEPTPSSKIAAFDIDGTLIKVKSGKKFPGSADDWELWSNNVPRKLQQAHTDGHVIVLFSNQNFKGPKFKKDFEAKLFQLARTFNVPFQVFAARERDRFRKPLTGMWDTFVNHHNGGIEPDLSKSFFVGDAAGRPAVGSSVKDWTDTDRKLALNIGVPFFTPEEWFGGKPARTDFVLGGFDPLKYDHDQPAWHPSTTPLALGPILTNSTTESVLMNPRHVPCEIVLFVGPPSVGKTTCFKGYFAPRAYRHVNQDTLKTADKCLAVVRESIGASQSCVVDNTNRSRQTRKPYISLARELGCQIRCVYFTAPIELAQHNNVYRAYYCASQEPPRSLLPTIAFSSYVKSFEEPCVDEGFDELKKVNFVFEGTDSERLAWEKYLL